MDSQKIVKLFWERNERALTETIKQYEAYCFTIAHNILNNQQDAEECVNDTWIRAWHSIPPQSPSNLRAFLAKITHNLSVDRLKQHRATKRHAQHVSFEELENCLYTADCGFADNVRLEELQKAINRFLYGIPERDRNVFIRRHFFCESIEAIANGYGLTQNHTTQILSRTRKKLRDFLEKEGYRI